jgi:hypothetical protein
LGTVNHGPKTDPKQTTISPGNALASVNGCSEWIVGHSEKAAPGSGPVAELLGTRLACQSDSYR